MNIVDEAKCMRGCSREHECVRFNNWDLEWRLFADFFPDPETNECDHFLNEIPTNTTPEKEADPSE